MITLVSIYPTLLGTYGDGGNVMALKHRAELQGLDVEVVTVESGEAVPESGDLYVMGGGEDSAQTAASNALRAGGAVKRAAERGAAVFAICAGYQLLGEYFPDATSTPTPGLGILDVRTDRLPKRAVGELAASCPGPARPGAHGLREPRRCNPPRSRRHTPGNGQGRHRQR
ncbi:MAG: hypothetical protein V9G10_13920 [Candidatus Nanopelagicales bacterium]